MIIVKGRELLIPENERYIGTNYDAGMENRLFRIPRYSQSGTDLSDLTFKVNLIFEGDPLDRAEMTKAVDDDYIYLTWIVTEAQVAVTGTVFVCVTGNDTNDTVKWSSFQAPFYTEKSLGDDIDTAYHDLVNKVAKEITDRESAVAAEKSAREAADTTLQQNINAEASARAAGDAALNNRIDNIVAQSGDDITEIVDARTGADNTVHASLKARLDAEHTDLKSAIQYLNRPNTIPSLTYAQGRYITIGGAIGNADGSTKTVSTSTAIAYSDADFCIFVNSGWKVAFPSFENGLQKSAAKTFISGPALISLDDIKNNVKSVGDSFAITVRKDPESTLMLADFVQDNAFIFTHVASILNGIISESNPVLRNYKKTGFYYVTADAINSVISDFQYAGTYNGGILEVYNGPFGTLQRYTDTNGIHPTWERIDNEAWRHVTNRFSVCGRGIGDVSNFDFNTAMVPGVWSIPANSAPISPLPEGYDIATRHLVISFYAAAGFGSFILFGNDGVWVKNSNLQKWDNIAFRNHYKKITWVAIGDSITDGRYSYIENGTVKTGTDHEGQYNYIASQILGMNPVIEYGYGGMGWLHVANDGTLLTDVLNMDLGDPDLITVCLGVNDRGSGTLGDTNSTANDGTISGAIRNCCVSLATNYSNAQIVFFTPLNSNSSGTIDTGWSRRGASRNNLDDIAALIKHWCGFYGIKVLDFLTESPINSYNIVDLFPDRLHPSKEAHVMIGHYLAGVLPVRN